MRTRSRNARSGKREDLGGLFVRSSWEHDYALILNDRVAKGEIERWEYEPKHFYFPVKRGNRTYTPDFKVFRIDGTHEWHEVKGWMDSASEIKLRRFALHFPDETLVLVDAPAFKILKARYKPELAGWES